MDKLMNLIKKFVMFSSILFLVTGLFAGCGEREEQSATDRTQQEGREPAVTGQAQEQEREGATGERAGEQQAGRTQAGEDMIGKQVVSSDGQVLGTVAVQNRTGEDAGYVFIKGEGNKMHPVPANLLEKDGDRLRASFDRNTFAQSPSFSEAEQQQLSESELEKVRGYYENQSQKSRQAPSGQPGEKPQERSPRTGTQQQ